MHPLVHELGARLRSFVRSRPVWGTAAVLLIGVMLFALPHASQAFAGEEYLAGAIAWVLGLIVNFLGKVISVLIYILMGFLQYNGFADAPPVMVGWVIVRDLVNMVFIIALIISAVATILNYETSDLHVKNVLPKLIGAAVLINFSKMIVGLLIDASQVVTLTFVNAFQASGVGNFSQLLGLPSFTTLNAQTPSNASASANPTAAAGAQASPNIILDVLLAYMLAMAMLVISIGVILIMILFTVGRIVGLWVLLIVSPAAFLATSLPKKLQRLFGSLASEFWKRLTGFLVGGPVMAFFLWLAFATVRSSQQLGAEGGVATRLGLFNREASPITRNGIYTANSVLSGAAEGSTNFFLSRVGNADGIASFIVGVALMLIGIEQAVHAAGEASATLGKYAGSIRDSTKDAARWLATRPVATPWNYADRRLKITDKAASTLALVPGLNNLSGGKLAKFSKYRKNEMDEMAKRDMELYGSLSGSFKKIKAGSINWWSRRNPLISTNADQKAAQLLGQDQSSDAGVKKTKRELSAKYESDLKKNRPTDAFTGRPIDDDELKNRAKAHAAGEADHKRSQGFKNALENAKKLEDWESVGKMEEEADKNPSLWKDTDRVRYGRAIKKMSDDEFEKNEELTTDGDAMLTRAEQAGAITVDKTTGAITGINAANFDQMVANMPKAAKRIRAVQAAVEGHAVGGAVTPAAATQIRSSAFLQDAAKMTSRVYDGGTGERVYSPIENANRAGLHAAFSSPSHGRAAPGALDVASQGHIDTALNTTNIGLKELMDIDKSLNGGIADNAIPNHVADRIGTELGAGAWATVSDVQGAMSTLAKTGEQMKDLDDRSQAVILESITTSGQIQQMAERLQDMTEYQQEQLLNMARQAQELSRSSALNAAGNPVKDDAVAFLTAMRAHMTQNRNVITLPGGATRDTQAPPAFKAVLYKK